MGSPGLVLSLQGLGSPQPTTRPREERRFLLKTRRLLSGPWPLPPAPPQAMVETSHHVSQDRKDKQRETTCMLAPVVRKGLPRNFRARAKVKKGVPARCPRKQWNTGRQAGLTAAMNLAGGCPATGNREPSWGKARVAGQSPGCLRGQERA